MKKILMTTSSNVIQIQPLKCPPKSHAKHQTYGICQILRARGKRRLVGYEEHRPIITLDDAEPLGHERPKDVLFLEQISWHETWVDVDELIELNPRLDLLDGPRGEVLAFTSCR